MTPVLFYKRKFDGSTKGPWEGELVEETGDWAVVFYRRIPPSQRTGAGDKPASGLRYHGMTRPVSILVYFDEDGGLMEYFCDAGLAATREGNELSFVDLDVDLVVAPDFSSFVRDYDDFATNCAAMHYPPEAGRPRSKAWRWRSTCSPAAKCPLMGTPNGCSSGCPRSKTAEAQPAGSASRFAWAGCHVPSSRKRAMPSFNSRSSG